MTTEPCAVVRPRTPADLAGCVAVLAAVHASDEYPAIWPKDAARWLTPAGLLDAWIAFDGSGILGHVALGRPDAELDRDLVKSAGRPSAALAEVKRLFVHPSARGRGIAKNLLEVAANGARTRALHPILEVTTDDPGAVGFYDRIGWRRIGSAVATWSRPSGAHPLLFHYELPG
jgi:[ribosomal protein S18]-alanine N-acetyltransferase